ncbi:hypothetical protein [Paenibacillus eucommiae]|uniref:Uncharacterized protein n=1 Tax=Paenibacillus eucommiae TaxID=1355755 RepID=A0ABS4J3Z6_9BACL|nr:hypothetical protein [Paenibacillus eucommiae]MBP1994567.1 hypothetical protein [Paenibacillus eucommiae]
MLGIPDYKSFMLPLLDILGDEQPHTLDSLNERLAIESGKQFLVESRGE